MDRSQYAAFISNELCDWTQNWIDALRDIRQQHATLSWAVPYPSFPLPIGFPLDEFTLSETFEWIHEDGSNQRRHIYNVRFIFQGRTRGPYSSVAWRVVNGSDDTVLGVFEIAGAIYDSPALPFQIDTDLVLEAMSVSLEERTPVHLVSHVVLVDTDPNTSPSNGLPRPLRIYEMRTPGPLFTVVRSLGACWEV